MGAVFSDITGVDTFEKLSGAEGIKVDAKSRENLAKFNAQVAENEATAKRQATKFATKRQAEKGARIKSSLKARIAASGGTGSPVSEDLQAEQASELELENLLIGFEGEVSAQQSKEQAKIDRAKGRIIRKKGQSDALAANIKFGTTLLAGF
jgi:hypothetical protein